MLSLTFLLTIVYQGKYRKVTTRKKKDPANKIAPSKKTSATKTESNAETENKKVSDTITSAHSLKQCLDYCISFLSDLFGSSLFFICS
jgi:hypothetical protein